MESKRLAESDAHECELRTAQQLEAHDRAGRKSRAATSKRLALVTALERARAAVVREELLASAAFTVLPRHLSRLIFSWLPADARLRSREVCRSWRALLEDRRLWWLLDLSPTIGVQRPTAALLRAASLRAGGQLRSLDVTGARISWEALRNVARANALSLRELRAWGLQNQNGEAVPSLFDIRSILSSALWLTTLQCDVDCSQAGVLPLLRKDPPFHVLRMRSLTVSRHGQRMDAEPLMEALGVHKSLTQLRLTKVAVSPAALDVLVNLAVARPFTALHFDGCREMQGSLPLLARLLREGAIEALSIKRMSSLFTSPDVADFSEALRDSRLKELSLDECDLLTDFSSDCPPGPALLNALVGHPSLQSLSLANNPLSAVGDLAIGEALGRLVTADSALTSLDVSSCGLGHDGSRPLFAAIARGARLRELSCSYNRMNLDFVQDDLLPAVRGNPWLRRLHVGEKDADELLAYKDDIRRHRLLLEADAMIAARVPDA